MYQRMFQILVILLIINFSSCKLFEKNPKTEEIFGCTDKLAYNYFPDATQDDGSCDYCTGKPGSSFILISSDGGVTWKRRCFNIPVSTITDISITIAGFIQGLRFLYRTLKLCFILPSTSFILLPVRYIKAFGLISLPPSPSGAYSLLIMPIKHLTTKIKLSLHFRARPLAQN